MLRNLLPHQWGINTLVEKIVDLQGGVVSNFFSCIVTVLKNKIQTLETERRALPTELTTNSEKKVFVNSAIFNIVQEFDGCVNGTKRQGNPTLNLCARFDEYAKRFYDILRISLPDYLTSEYSDRLVQEIQETRGISLDNFVSGVLFRDLIVDAFESPLADGIVAFLDGTVELVRNVLTNIINKSTGEYKKLAAVLVDAVSDLLDQQKHKAQAVVDLLVRSENTVCLTQDENYMNSVHKFRADVVKTHEAHIRPTNGNKNGVHTGSDSTFDSIMGKAVDAMKCSNNQDVYEMQVSLHCYSTIRRKRIVDNVMFSIRTFMLSDIRDEFFRKVGVLEDLLESMEENIQIVKKRQAIMESLRRLKNSLREVESVR